MLIKLNFPVSRIFESLKPTIELEVSTRFNLANLPLSLYLKERQVRALLKIEPKELKAFLIQSKLVHGVELPDKSIRVHPAPVYKQIVKKYTKIIKTELKRKVA